ncbi:MAG: hypothetical protein VX517_02675 [Candidatus Neomarinimicrobiota bacterium]|jgi:hypothetical protein|nr:hypothetical protein [Candidatus Neomarinimicrobiota bacterium]|tara:strand:+ start:1164 stop:1454 length:291 start_codon:yes stop_codon:yes gene_type:complete
MINFLYDLISQLFLGFIDGGLLAGLFFIASTVYGFILKRYRPLPKKFLEDGIVVLLITMLIFRLLLVLKVYMFNSQDFVLFFELPDSLILDSFYYR